MIRYPKVVIKSLSSNLELCLNYHANAYLQSWNFVRVISIALLNGLADFATEIHLSRETIDHANASNVCESPYN